MSLPLQTFSGITPEVFTTISSKLDAAYGIQLAGDSGMISHSGFKLYYQYHRDAQELDLQCISKPFLIPQSTVQNGIAEHVEEAKSECVVRASLDNK